MRTGSCVTGEVQWPAAVAPGIQIVHVIEHPQRVKSRLSGHTALLPVEPPEVDALIFHTVMHVKICIDEVRIGQVEFRSLPGRGVNADTFRDRLVIVLVRTYAVARMHVQCGLQPAFVQTAQKCTMIRE